MKKVAVLLSLFAGALFFFSCEEEPPPGLDFSEPPLTDTTYVITTIPSPEVKNVLLEDVTGVNCNNCPNAAAKAKEIATKYNRVKVLALYADLSSLTEPFDGYEDLRTQESKDIVVDTELPTGIPVGYVDRISVNNSKAFFHRDWETFVDKQLLLSTPVNIKLESEFTEKDTTVKATVKVTYTEAVSDDHAITLVLVENNIKSKQKMPDNSSNPDYKHGHVLRTTLTPSTGSLITAEKVKGLVVEKAFKLKLKDHWKPQDCTLLALVQNTTTKEVIHVQEVNIK